MPRPENVSEFSDSGHWRPVVKVQRRTEGGDAPGWQGATSENTGSI